MITSHFVNSRHNVGRKHYLLEDCASAGKVENLSSHNTNATIIRSIQLSTHHTNVKSEI